MARDVNGFTPTQARIMYVLQDGTWHSAAELEKAVDEYCSGSLLRAHLTYLRRILDTRQEVIKVSYKQGVTYYMHSKLLAPMING